MTKERYMACPSVKTYSAHPKFPNFFPQNSFVVDLTVV